MPKIMIANLPMTYQVTIKKKLKTIRIRVAAIDKLEITAPGKIATAYIEKLLEDKSKWIKKQVNRLSETAENPVNKRIVDRAQILFLGIPRVLIFRTVSNTLPHISLHPHDISLSYPPSDGNDTAVIQASLKKWYIDSATDIFHARTVKWAHKIGVNPKRICIKEQKTRWGSCSTSGIINYNWRAIMAPLEVIDYLVVHELCHMLVPNHSHDFWELVSQFIPNCKELRRWLNSNSALLSGIL